LPSIRSFLPQIVLVNPQIINSGKMTNLFEEGCLSFPNIYADVEVGLLAAGGGAGGGQRAHSLA
jgi:hypothetical protein